MGRRPAGNPAEINSRKRPQGEPEMDTFDRCFNSNEPRGAQINVQPQKRVFVSSNAQQRLDRKSVV